MSELHEALVDIENRFREANPLSEQQFERARESLAGGNTRTAVYYSPFPVTIASGEGAHLTDLDGHTYVDLLGDYSAGLYGHSNKVILDAVQQALARGVTLGGPGLDEERFGRALVQRFPSVELVRFTNSGTEANLMAMVTSLAVTGRKKVMVFDGSYHGSVFSFRGTAALNAPFDFVIAPYNDLVGTLEMFDQVVDDLACVIVEPMLGGGGAIPGTPEFLGGLREACTNGDVLLIFDEVMTSRLGPSGVQGRLGITPDLTTFGKYLGGGFSFGAFGGSREIMEHFDPTKSGAFVHPGTFNNNVVTMAAGSAGLEHVFTADVAESHNARGDWLRDQLNGLFEARGVAMQATGLGSIIAIHFQRSPIAAADDVQPAQDERALFHLEMLLDGFYFARRGYLALPLAVDQPELEDFLATVDSFIDRRRPLLEAAG